MMKSNALVIDYKYCDGCNSCVVACKQVKDLTIDEWGIKLVEAGPEKIDDQWMWNFIPYLSKRCDLCEDRVDEGKKPLCVQSCLSACMYLVPLEEVSAKIAELGDEIEVIIP